MSSENPKGSAPSFKDDFCGMLRYAAYLEYTATLEEHASNFALQEGCRKLQLEMLLHFWSANTFRAHNPGGTALVMRVLF